MALPPTRTTIEAQLPYAADFCELVSQALGGDVFHTALIVTPGRLWHYPTAPLSCRLRFNHTSQRITIHNSNAACHWLDKHATGRHNAPNPTEQLASVTGG